MKATLGAGLSSLQGKLGNLCAKVINGRQQLGRLSVPYSVSGEDPSADQVAQMEWYAAKVAEWRAASPAQRATWDTAGDSLGISGFNYWLTLLVPTWPDRGLVWTLAQRLGTETYVYSLAYLGNGVCLAGTGITGKVYRSTDSGLTWTPAQRLGMEMYVYSLAYLGAGVCLAGTGITGQVYRSTDSGLTWTLAQRLERESVV
jgi:photosystem II stability/assembly factor-like uncharacterized protein